MVRTWVKLGVAYLKGGRAHDATRMFLNALSLSPEVEGSWGLVKTALVAMGKSQ